MRSVSAGDIILHGDITASGGAGATAGDIGGSGGIVTVLNEGGAVTVGNIQSLGGAGNGGGVQGTKGVVQFSATGGVDQHPVTTILAGQLKVLSQGVVALTNDGNDVETLAADASASASFSYVDANTFSVGTIGPQGTGAGDLLPVGGITSSTGNTDIDLRTGDGILFVDARIQAPGSGNIELRTQGIGVNTISPGKTTEQVDGAG